VLGMSELKDQVVVITGGSSGIGEATAVAAANKGAKVVLAARRVDRLKKIVERIQESGGIAAYLKADVTSRDEMKELAAFAKNEFGSIDVWVNNAGLMPLSFVDKLKIDEWDRMIDVNIKGVLYGIAAALPIMEEQNGGHIVNVSSVAGHRVGMGGAVYSGTKFAVRAISEGLRQEISPKSNIRTTIISPGSVKTELRDTITDEDALEILKNRNIRVPLEAVDIARSIVYAIEQPRHVSVNEIIIRPTDQRA
jgi:NADP-dependent 3-hydroxy acid dehydrogenase YdfG